MEFKKVGKYMLTALLGSGQFGKVYLSYLIEDPSKYFAIKCVSKRKIASGRKFKELFESEVIIMSSINHPNVLQLIELHESANNYYLVMDFCNKGDLSSYVEKRHHLSEPEAIYFFKQIMNGFRALHKAKVMHRDVKLANIFLHNDIVKIGDFGFAKMGVDETGTNLGTPITQAPELYSMKEKYTSKADLWSLGVCYYQILFGEFPFDGNSIDNLKRKALDYSGNNLVFPGYPLISQESKNLIVALLQSKPENRIEWFDFFNHPIFSIDFFASRSESEPISNFSIELTDNFHRSELEFKKNQKENPDLSYFDENFSSSVERPERNESKSLGKSQFVESKEIGVKENTPQCDLQQNSKDSIYRSIGDGIKNTQDVKDDTNVKYKADKSDPPSNPIKDNKYSKSTFLNPINLFKHFQEDIQTTPIKSIKENTRTREILDTPINSSKKDLSQEYIDTPSKETPPKTSSKPFESILILLNREKTISMMNMKLARAMRNISKFKLTSQKTSNLFMMTLLICIKKGLWITNRMISCIKFGNNEFSEREFISFCVSEKAQEKILPSFIQTQKTQQEFFDQMSENFQEFFSFSKKIDEIFENEKIECVDKANLELLAFFKTLRLEALKMDASSDYGNQFIKAVLFLGMSLGVLCYGQIRNYIKEIFLEEIDKLEKIEDNQCLRSMLEQYKL